VKRLTRICVVGIIVGTCWQGLAFGQDAEDEIRDRLPEIEGGQEIPQSQDDPLIRVYNAAVKGVVRVDTPRGQGSGFIIGRNGVVITNYHVIQNAESAVVRFNDGKTRGIDGILTYDVEQDLAALKFDPAGLDLHPLTLAERLPPKMSQALAIGHGLGFDSVPSPGRIVDIVTGKDIVKNCGWRGIAPGTEWVRTSTPIWHGNSGGPLLSVDGQVVGVNTLGGLPRGETTPMFFAASVLKLRQLLASGSTTSVPLKDVAAKEKNRPTIEGWPELPGALAGWVPDKKYSRAEVGRTAVRARAALLCKKCGGTGRAVRKQIREVRSGSRVGIRQKQVTTQSIPCPECAARGFCWSRRQAYSLVTRATKGILCADESTFREGQLETLRKSIREIITKAAVDTLKGARECNACAKEVLANPEKNVGESCIFYAEFVARRAYGKDTIAFVRVYGSGELFVVATSENLGALKGQYCLVAGINVGTRLIPTSNGTAAVPTVYAFAIEKLR
jgi:S1-C subfamily serine protease